MTPQVVLSSAAERDLAEQAAFLGQHDPGVGEQFLAAATKTFQELLTAPASGELFRSKKQALSRLRIWRVDNFPNHVIVYRGTREEIFVVRVFHAAQDWQSLLEGAAQ